MDPNANLDEQIRIARAVLDANEDEPMEDPEGDLRRMCELVEALDSWIRRGGFLPKVWERKERGG